MLAEKSFLEILEKIASKEPVPGGGSVSAMTLALGSALSIMVVRFSKPESSQTLQNAEKTFLNTLNSAVKLVDEDIDAYNKVTQAYRLPKSTEEEKKKRKEEINKSLFIAAEPPYKGCNLAQQALQAIKEIKDSLNQNLVSDIGVAVSLFKSSFDGFFFNVKINLKDLKSEQALSILNDVASLQKKVDILYEELKNSLDFGD